MPHIVLDYASPLEGIILEPEFREGLIQKLLENSDFERSHIKYRSVKYSDYDCPAADVFVHVTIKMLSGRTRDQKQKIARSAVMYFKGFLSPRLKSKNLRVECTVEIQELDKTIYEKWVS